MNSGFSDFQDLINTTTSGEDLQAIQDEVKSLEEEVADNKTNIQTNSALISLNTTSIANNLNTINFNVGAININTNAINNNAVNLQIETNRITTNQTNIGTNSALITGNTQAVITEASRIDTNISNIGVNTQTISGNSQDITSLNNTVLLRDGSVTLDPTFTPTNSYDLVSKSYVDTHSTSGNYLRTDGTNGMLADLNMGSNSLMNIFDINGTNWSTHVSTVQQNTTNIGTKLNSNNGTVTNYLYFTNANNYILRTGSALRIESSDYLWFNIGMTLYAQIGNNLFSVYEDMEFTSNLNGISVAEFSRLSGVTSSIQPQLNERIKIDGSVSMTGDLNLGGQSIINTDDVYVSGFLQTDTITSSAATTPVNIFEDRGLMTHSIESNGYNFQIDLRCKSILNMLGNQILNAGLINGYSLATFNTSINTNTNNITNNSYGIGTNSSNISYNDGRITTNSSNISINTTDIATNANAIPLKVSKSGDTMTGTLNFNYPNIYAEFGKNASNHTNGSGSVDYNVASTTKHELVLRGAQSLLDTNNERHARVDGYLEVDDGLLVKDSETVLEGSSGNMIGSGLRQLYLRHPLCPSNKEYGWRMGCQNTLNTSSTDCDMYFEVMRGTSSRIAAGLWDQNGSSSAINFTGQHRCMPDFEFTEDKVGLIVESAGRYMNFIKEGEACSQLSCITINDSLPVVQICTDEKSKKVFGVVSSEEEKDRHFQQGVFVSFFDKVAQDERLYINSVGEGAIWVCSKNGNFENGDYICSAGVGGYGMKQDSEFLANYTVAKITMSVDFNPQMEEVKIWEDGGWVMTGEYKPQYECITLDDGMKIAFVGCTYHCG